MSNFDLPTDVPWYLIAASPDMMDTTFCADAFPPAFHSSLAIYAYEPAPDDLPAQLCNQKITYLKVTSSITGYQPTASETAAINPPPLPADPAPVTLMFPDVPGGAIQDNADVYGDFTDAYFACYGVLLNIAVFPSVTSLPQSTGVQKGYEFDTNGPYANPFTANGLTFTLSSLAARIYPQLPVHAGGGLALQIDNAILDIELPISTNVSLTMRIDKSDTGTITAFLRDVQVFQAPLTKGSGTIDINTSSPITRITIQSTDDGNVLNAIDYSVLERPITLADYPHIVDFEPKTRDLYQAATDQGEILTGSDSGISTGKSMSSTSSSQMGLGLGVSGGLAAGNQGGPNVNVSGQLTSQWGNSSTDASNTQIDQSRERRETQGTTTNITQQYNLLTGYHAGTNRAAFLMLPRPHTLQATDYRTFVRGLRMIEGLQDFFLIVSRPPDMPGICVEAVLETGHFPENVALGPPIVPTVAGETTQFIEAIPAYVPGHNVSGQNSYNTTGGEPQPPTVPYTLPSGWIFDSTKGDPSSPGVSLPTLSAYPAGLSDGDTAAGALAQAQSNHIATCQIINETSCSFYISVQSDGNPLANGTGASAVFTFTIFATQDPSTIVTVADPEPTVVSDFLVTSRSLCACLNSCSVNNCVMIAPTEQVPYADSPGPIPGGIAVPANAAPGRQLTTLKSGANAAPAAKSTGDASQSAAPVKPLAKRSTYTGKLVINPANDDANARSSIVYEAKLKVPRGLLKPESLQASRTPVARELMHQIQHHMLNSWRMPHRRAHNEVGFLESDYLCERLRGKLPRLYLASRIANVPGVSPAVRERFGKAATIRDVLMLDLYGLSKRAGLNVPDAVALRRLLLGFGGKDGSSEAARGAATTDPAGQAADTGKSSPDGGAATNKPTKKRR